MMIIDLIIFILIIRLMTKQRRKYRVLHYVSARF
jgi:hypothetical protein